MKGKYSHGRGGGKRAFHLENIRNREPWWRRDEGSLAGRTRNSYGYLTALLESSHLHNSKKKACVRLSAAVLTWPRYNAGEGD